MTALNRAANGTKRLLFLTRLSDNCLTLNFPACPDEVLSLELIKMACPG